MPAPDDTDNSPELDEILTAHLQDIRAGHDSMLRTKLLAYTQSQIAKTLDRAKTEAVTEFCDMIQRKVKLEFEAGGRYPGHIIDPWRDVVRPEIYSRTTLKEDIK